LRPPGARGAGLWRIWWWRTQLCLAELFALWPDQIHKARWRRHCRCTGIEHLEAARGGGRPVILATLHFGPLIVLRYWLRARGFPLAALLGGPLRHRSVYRRYLDRISDAAGGLAGVAHVFDLDQLRQVHEFLELRGLLLVTVDGGGATQHLQIQGSDFSFRMATGALRLAARANAPVIPCLIRADWPAGITIHFGQPLETAWVADRRQHNIACEHLLCFFLPLLQAQPELSWYQLLWCFEVAKSPPEMAAMAIPERAS
jgi:hypothetical protein